MRYRRAEALYRLLLAAYPPEFRAEYQADMEDGFRTQLRHEVVLHGRVRWHWVWAMVLWDTVTNGAAQRWNRSTPAPARSASTTTSRSKRIMGTGREMMGSLVSDVRYALRALRRNPVFTATAIVTLALGIGANTAIFSIVNGLLIRDLPYADSDRLVHIWAQNQARGWNHTDIPVVDAWDFRNRTSAFEDVAVYNRRTFTLTGTDQPERLSGHQVTPNVFDVLGVSPATGRTFVDADNAEQAPLVAVISDGFWKRRYGGDPAIVGQTVMLDGEAATVIGVMPERFPFIQSRPDLWVPFRQDPALARRGNRSNVSVARMAPGVSLDQVNREVAQVAMALEQEHPDTNEGWGAYAITVQRDALGEIGFTAALVLMVTVGFVLLIACANVANLLLARANGRRQEMAIRAAMGAGRIRIIRQTLTESLVLAGIGGILGVLLSLWGTRVIVAGMPANLPPVYRFEMDGTVLVFAVLASLAAAVLFGLAPALRSAQAGAADLKDGGRTGQAARGRRFGGFLIVAQTALAVVLLIGGGVTAKSVMGIASLDLGYRTDGVMTFKTSPPEAAYPDAATVTAFHDELQERLLTLPGVDAASAVWNAPLAGSNSGGSFYLAGDDLEDVSAGNPARYNWVAPGYFATMGVPLLQGRELFRSDDVDAPPVVVVNQTLSDRFFGADGAVGETLYLSGDPYEIVGVVGDHVERNLSDPIQPSVYMNVRDGSTARARTVVVRTAGDPASLVPLIRREVLAMQADLPIFAVQPMTTFVDTATSGFALIAKLMGGFALISLVLGAVGIYGVTAYGVGQRTHEIGIRMAMGAGREEVRRMVVSAGMRRSVLGLILGLGLAFVATGAMSALLVGVSPRDPSVFTGVILLLVGVAFLGSYVPARRASAVNPIEALSQE